jgi:dienelactone hydrolase
MIREPTWAVRRARGMGTRPNPVDTPLKEAQQSVRENIKKGLFMLGRLASVFGLIAASAAAQTSTTAPAPTIVSLKAPDGVALKASYFSAGRPGPGILMLHACNRERKSWTHLATDAAARGYHVLALDFRGYGESAGERFEQFQEQQPVVDGKWPGDVDAAFTWLTAQPGVDKERIAAAGASCGVNQSVQLARRHPEVRTVVLLSGNTNPAGRQFLRDSPWLPIFASASQGDGGAVETMQWTMGWSRNPKNKFVEYKAAGHGTDMFAVEKGLEPAILSWFDAHLKNAQTTKPASPAPAKPTLIEEFWTTLTTPGGAAKARQIYDEAKRKTPNVVLFPEGEVNLYGYQLLQGGNPKEAVEVFKLNVDAYPNSANVYDSLSDGYLELGNKEEALRNAEKALAMLAKDKNITEEFRNAVRESAEKKIQQLKK